MAFSLFPDPQSRQAAHQISLLSWVVLGCGLLLLMVLNALHQKSYSLVRSHPIVPKQELFESLPPQVLEFSLGGATY